MWSDLRAAVPQGSSVLQSLASSLPDVALASRAPSTSSKEEELGFTITQRKSRRNPAITETDLDFANDIALLSNGVDQVQKPLTLTESESEKAGQQLNPKKTEVIEYKSSFDTLLKTMEDSTENNKKARKGKASKVLNDMKIWKSNKSRGVKLSFFKATVESVLLHRGETWTLAPTLTKSINGGLECFLTNHTSKEDLYGDLPRVRD
ncbi:unnamed protein product, partial [Porites lobata]